MEERRKLKRQFLIFFGRIFDRKSSLLLGNLADLSVEGAMIISGRPIETGKTYELRLDLPAEIFSIDHIDLEARSVWCQPDIDPSLFTTGFELTSMDPEKTAVIHQIIKKYGIRESKTRKS